MPPSPASIWGSTAAQPMPSIRRRPSCTPGGQRRLEQPHRQDKAQDRAGRQRHQRHLFGIGQRAARANAGMEGPGCRPAVTAGIASAGSQQPVAQPRRRCGARLHADAVSGRRLEAESRPAPPWPAASRRWRDRATTIPPASSTANSPQNSALRQALVAGMAQREAREHRAGQPVKRLKPDHGRAANRRSSRHSRTYHAPPARSAAVGNAHSAMRGGDTKISVLRQKAPDQQHRADGDEQVFAKEKRDIVHRRGMGADMIARGVIQWAVDALRRIPPSAPPAAAPSAPDRPARSGPERRSPAAPGNKACQHAPGAGAANLRHQGCARVRFKPAAFQQPDHRQHQPHNRDEAVGDKGLAQRRHHHQRTPSPPPGR